MEKTSIHERLYNQSRKVTKPALQQPTTKKPTGSTKGIHERLYKDSKLLSKNKVRKEVPEIPDCTFAPIINKEINSERKSLIDNKLRIPSNPADDYSFQPKISEKSRALVKSPPSNVFSNLYHDYRRKSRIQNSDSEPTFKPNLISKQVSPSKYSFLERLDIHAKKHQKEHNKLKKQFAGNFDRTTGRPFFYPELYTTRY